AFLPDYVAFVKSEEADGAYHPKRAKPWQSARRVRGEAAG
ncbi:MAG: hypothetical protein RIS35_248, partial [Pseudomonadota bacterium]